MDKFLSTEPPEGSYAPQIGPARTHARALEAAGFSTAVAFDARDNVSLCLSYNKADLGRISVWISGHVTFHEIKLETFSRAIREACHGNVELARSLASEAAAALPSGPDVWTAHVASTGSATYSAFGVTMMKDGVEHGGAAGDIDAPEAVADVEVTTRIVTKANAAEIDRLVVYASPQIMKYAEGTLNSSSPHVARLRESLQMGTKVTLRLRDPHSAGCRSAKRRADDRFAKATGSV